MKLQLVTLGGVAIDEQIYEIIMPTSEGQISVFPGHEDLVTVAVPGVIAVRKQKGDEDDRLEYFAISGGVVMISENQVKILVDEADYGADIIEAETLAALERAEEMRDNAKNQIELEKAHQLVDRHRVRLRVAELHRRHHRG